jgi:BirA family transcriptional regulator, biotin operon repressor / biotin---[acetyl-CoA-carboxylase] ligase
MLARNHNQNCAVTAEARPLRIRDVEDGLAPRRLGTRFYYFREIDSTNNYARALAERGEPQGAIVIAERQTLGRGRLGRSWVSPPYVNLYCSIILRPTLPPAHTPRITLTAAVALADAVEGFSPVAPVIKWPNDILAGGKKLAGVLTEAVSNSQRVEFVILGIGVNLNYSPDSMPPEIRERATSLSVLAGRRVSREGFLRRLLQDLDRCYGILEETGFAALAPRWDARFGLRGRRVRVEMTDRTIIGRAIGIDADGALIIEAPDGGRQRIVAGDVIPIEE